MQRQNATALSTSTWPRHRALVHRVMATFTWLLEAKLLEKPAREATLAASAASAAGTSLARLAGQQVHVGLRQVRGGEEHEHAKDAVQRAVVLRPQLGSHLPRLFNASIPPTSRLSMKLNVPSSSSLTSRSRHCLFTKSCNCGVTCVALRPLESSKSVIFDSFTRPPLHLDRPTEAF